MNGRRGTDFRDYCYTRLWEIENEWMDQQITDINHAADRGDESLSPTVVWMLMCMTFAVGFVVCMLLGK